MASLTVSILLLVAAASGAVAQTPRLSFKEIPAASGTETIVRTATEVTIDNVTYAIQWKPILESGKNYTAWDGGVWPAGQVLDKTGAVLSVDPAIARDFDRTSIINKFGQIWMITHNEDSYGMFYQFLLNQDPVTGDLTIAKARTLNSGAIYGAIRPCSGSSTPWKTHLAGLESVQDARTFPPSSSVSAFVAQALILKLASWRDVNPYWYGWYLEVAVTSAAGDYSMVKHYSMGRAPWETGVVLPDQRTVICSDDTGSGGIMTMFVADKPADLSCGRLYTSKMTQLSPSDGGSFSVSWIPLTNGSVCNSFVASYIEKPGYNESIKFADLFDYMAPVMNGSVPNLSMKPADYVEVRSIGTRYEWLRLKPGMQNLAAVLETARFTAYMGGCNEWSKLEGIAYDWITREVYLGVTAIQNAMLDGNANDVGGPNQMRLPFNPAGAVYKMKTVNMPGLSRYTPISARAAITGFGYNATATTASKVPEISIAEPDNVDIMPRYKTLIISEDSDLHGNNYAWAMNVETGALTRIMSVPIVAEVTSAYYFANVGNFSYLSATVQHPRTQDMPCTMGVWTLPRENV